MVDGGLELGGVVIDIGEFGNGGHEGLVLNFDFLDFDPDSTPNGGVDFVVDGHGAGNGTKSTNGIEVFGLGVVDTGRDLRNKDDLIVGGSGLVDGRDGN